MNQPLVEHLKELRLRLIRSLAAMAIGTVVSWAYSDKLFDVIRRPIMPYLKAPGGLVFTGVMDDFMAHIKIALLSGVILTCPVWLYQLWKFVAPGLYSNERRYSLGFILFGSALFASGVTFAYFVVYPVAFEFLLNFSAGKDLPMITIKEYLSFFFTTTLLFGAAFELPLVLLLLGLTGLIDQRFLKTKRRYAIVLLSVIAAILAPPDLISMIMMLVPMVALYEVGVILVGFFEKKRMAEV